MADNILNLFCLVDGEGTPNAFSVKIASTDTVDDLKVHIKTKKSPEFDDIAADKLILWRVSHPIIEANKHNPVHLSKIDAPTELNPTNVIANVFAEAPPKETIRIIVKRPLSDRVSEAEFVQHVLRDITGISQRPRTRTDSRREYSLTPTSVQDWVAFLPMVGHLPLDAELRYSRPSFSSVRTFTIESDLQGIFRHDVGSVRNLPPFADTHGSSSLAFGTPDLVCSREIDHSVLFPIEMKRPIELHLDDSTSYPAAYLAQGSLSQGPVGPLKQIFGYIRLNGFQYGVLSTYTQTWFIKRIAEHGDDILVSPTIRFDRTNPTLLRCYMWLIRTAGNDAAWQPDTPDEASVEAMLSKEQPDAKAAKRDSDFNPGRSGKLKQGMKSLFTRSKAKAQQTRAMQQERLTIPAFKNLMPITDGEGARTFRATWMNEDVVVKKADVWNQHLVADELKHEAKVYEALRTLQGRYVPELKLAGVADGMEMILATELAGTDLSDRRLDASDRNKIRDALSAIHNLGILHGDIRPENITTKRDDQNSQFFFIDFGRSEFTRRKMVLKCENEQLEALLDKMPWPEGKDG
ncbi:MAG: hypothetical protein J3R72DRAFT_459113 [Linnemannia gamsii]|nr:MAG: hypothetical protein J3R72DRAFT_459113 [Linnemannia gamsii]